MRTFHATLGGRTVDIFVPDPQDPALATLRFYFPAGGLYGLDVESTHLQAPKDAPGDYGTRTGPGPYHLDWKMRLIQFGTEHYAWVLNVKYPAHREAARALLADPGVHFTSHTQIDPIAVDLTFGIDITDRTLDTYFLSVMASPDHRDGGNELKPHVTRLIGPELEQAEEEMQAEFDRLYREVNKVMVDAEGDVMLTPSGKPRVVTEKTAIKKKHILVPWGFTNIDDEDENYLKYAGLDAVAVRRLAPMLREETKAPDHLIANERWLSQQSMKISRRGHRVDVDRLHSLFAETDVQATSISEELADATKGFISSKGEHEEGLGPRQRERLIEFLTEQGVDWSSHPKTPVTKKGGGGGPSLSVSKGHVELLQAQANLTEVGRRAVKVLLRYNVTINRWTVTRSMIDKLCGDRIHPTLKTVGTVTGRMAASGPNMQNFAKKDAAMRGLFLPEIGFVLMSCDFAQIELRVLAALAQEPAMIQTILDGGDLHDLTASLLGITRAEAKTVNFLIVYGGGGAKLAGQLGFPEDVDPTLWIERCKEIVSTYWQQYPQINGYKRWIEQFDQLELISGRRIPVDPNRTYANLNYMIQGSARELLVGAWRRFGVQYGRADTVWMPIHDELILQVPEELAEATSKEITDCMTFDFMGVPIIAEPDVLLDEHGVSRWMSGDHARECDCTRRGHHLVNKTADKCLHCGNKIAKQAVAA